MWPFGTVRYWQVCKLEDKELKEFWKTKFKHDNPFCAIFFHYKSSWELDFPDSIQDTVLGITKDLPAAVSLFYIQHTGFCIISLQTTYMF